MFENVLNGVFDGSIFGKIGVGMCKLTPNGQIAVKTSTGFKSWNMEKKRLTNQSNFVFDIGDSFFFVVPTNKVKPGDIILVQGKPKCVVSADKDRIEAVNYESGTLETILPERHVFMGNTYFYGKIVSLFGSAFKTKKGNNNMFKMFLQMQMMQSMMGNSSSNNGGTNDMFQTMMMMQMFGGKDGFGDMFDGMFDFDDDDDTDIIKNLMDNDEDTDEDNKEEE